MNEEAVPDVVMGEQTWPSPEELAASNAKVMETENENKNKKQDEEDQTERSSIDSDDDSDDDDSLMNMEDEDLMVDEDALAAVSKEKANEDEVWFPDEVEVTPEMKGRERFQKYRGLKSFRSSPWHPKDGVPREYSYIYQLENVKSLQKGIFEEAKEKEEAWLNERKGNPMLVPGYADCVCPGTFIEIELQNVGADVLDNISKKKLPLILFSLLDHEQRLTVVNCNVQRVSTYEKPIKSRELLTLHCGFWRRQVRPTFSENNLNCDKHKLDRYLQPGRWTVASAYAPVTFGNNVPAMLFDEENELVAAGSLLELNPDRIVLKKAVLAGYPIRNKKRNAVVRFMFHNPEDVKWFKPVELWTKYGLSGRIIDTLGTHGLFKANFDRNVKNNDTVCMSLYKRVFPKPVGSQFNSVQ